MRDKILKKLKRDSRKHTISGMAAEINIPYTNLYRIIKGQGDCNLRTWEKIENYYQRGDCNG